MLDNYGGIYLYSCYSVYENGIYILNYNILTLTNDGFKNYISTSVLSWSHALRRMSGYEKTSNATD